MARRNAVREQLLAEARARTRAAGQKVSRLERSGVRIKQAGLDPRAARTDLGTMSARQLRSYVNRLNAFTARSNGYVAGLKGTPLSASTVREYRAAERQRNANSAKFYESIKDLPIKGLGQTVQERLDSLSRSKSAFGDYFSFATPDKNGNYPERNVGNITGQDNLKNLLSQMQRRNDPRYLEKEARLTSSVLNKILAKTANADLIPLLKQATNEELITLTQYMGFTKVLESTYAMSKSTSTDTPAWQSSVLEDNEDTLRDWAEWVSNHFDNTSTRQDTETDAKSAPKPGRDKYGRFVRKNVANPEPVFARDKQGRFTKR